VSFDTYSEAEVEDPLAHLLGQDESENGDEEELADNYASLSNGKSVHFVEIDYSPAKDSNKTSNPRPTIEAESTELEELSAAVAKAKAANDTLERQHEKFITPIMGKSENTEAKSKEEDGGSLSITYQESGITSLSNSNLRQMWSLATNITSWCSSTRGKYRYAFMSHGKSILQAR
jgi:hypothetical protein